jgi:hypothetical protein
MRARKTTPHRWPNSRNALPAFLLAACLPAGASLFHFHRSHRRAVSSAASGTKVFRAPATRRILFGRDLGAAAGLRIEGPHVTSGLDFESSIVGKVGGAELHLILSHDPRLDGNRSYLTVKLNYGIIRSLTLDDSNAGPVEVVIPLDAASLRHHNRLVFLVDQAVGESPVPAGAAPGGREAMRSASEPPAPAMPEAPWTEILPNSFLLLPSAGSADLRNLPAPLVDRYSYEPQLFDVLLPRQFDLPGLRATAIAIADVVAAARPKPVRVEYVESVGAADHPLLIVGGPAEQPALYALAPDFVSADGRITVGRRVLDGSDGLLTLVSTSRGLPVVIVTGGSPLGVLAAARQIAAFGSTPGSSADAARQPGLSRRWVIVHDNGSPTEALPRANPRSWPGFIPPDREFDLRDLGPRALPLSDENGYRGHRTRRSARCSIFRARPLRRAALQILGVCAGQSVNAAAREFEWSAAAGDHRRTRCGPREPSRTGLAISPRGSPQSV